MILLSHRGAPCLHRSRCRLHNHARLATARILARFANLHLVVGRARPKRARTTRIGGHFLVVPADFADEVVEGVFDVDAGSGGGFDEAAAELTGEGFSFYRRC